MKRSATAVVLTGAFALLAWPAAGQSLTEAAAKEKERRAKSKPGKTYTVRELESAGSGDVTDTPTADASPKPGGATPTAEEEQAKKEAEWRKRRDAATKEATVWGEEVTRIQTQLNDNTQSPYGPARQSAVTALEEAKAKVTIAQKQLADLEDEGKRNRYR